MRALLVAIAALLVVGCSKKEPAKGQPGEPPAQPQSPPTTTTTTPPTPEPGPPTPAPTADPTPAFDPCSLLSAADIEVATKEKTAAKVSPDVYATGVEPPAWPKKSRCIYALLGEGRTRQIAVVDIDRYESPDRAKAEWERLFKAKGDSQPIPGLGDDAQWWLPNARFLKGRFVVHVRRELLDGREQEISTALAKRAATKMP